VVEVFANDIPFVPSKATAWFPKHAEVSLVPFKGSARLCDHNKAFTVLPVLANSYDCPKPLHQHLVSPLPEDVVARHLANVCREYQDGVPAAEQDNFADILDECFTFLSESISTGLGTQILEAIKACPIIMLEAGKLACIDTVFFKVQQVWTAPPYITELPRKWGRYDALFKLLGVKDSPQSSDYVNILRKLGREYKERVLPPNEWKAAKLAVVGIVVASAKSTIDSDAQFAPDKQMMLQPCDRLVVPNAPWLQCRVNPELLSFVHPRILEEGSKLTFLDSDAFCTRLKAVMGIPLLSDCIREEVDVNSDMLAVEPDEHSVIEDLGIRIRSEEFARALKRIIHFESPQKLSNEILHMINRLSSCELLCVDSLQTKLIRTDSGADVTHRENGSETVAHHSTKLCFGDLDRRRILVVASCAVIELQQELAYEINNLLHSPISDNLLLFRILGASPQEMAPILDLLHVTNLAGASDHVMPGEPLLQAHLELICQDPEQAFYDGEMVAYEAEENVFIYATLRRVFGKGLRRRASLEVGSGVMKENISVVYLYRYGPAQKQGVQQDPQSHQGHAEGQLQLTPANSSTQAAGTRDVPSQPAPDNPAQSTPEKPRTLREKLTQVRATLAEALQLPQDEQQCVIRRLYKQWHPDKNMDDTEHSTIIFRYIRQAAKEGHIPPWPAECPGEEAGGSQQMPSSHDRSGARTHRQGHGFGSGGFGFSSSTDWEEKFNSWDRSSRRHHSGNRHRAYDHGGDVAFLHEGRRHVPLKRAGSHNGMPVFTRSC